MTKAQAGQFGIRFPDCGRDCLFPDTTTSSLRSTQLSVHVLPEVPLLEVKRPGREVDHLHHLVPTLRMTGFTPSRTPAFTANIYYYFIFVTNLLGF
jgi:hypothetical protein